MKVCRSNLRSLQHLFFTNTAKEAYKTLITAGAKRPLKCRIVSVEAMQEESDNPFRFRITDKGLEAVWCGAIAEIMVYYDDGMSDSLIVEWLAEQRPLDALEAHSLASAFTPPLVALVNAPPHAEVELQAAWSMLMDVELAASGQEHLSSDEINDWWSQVLVQPGMSSRS